MQKKIKAHNTRSTGDGRKITGLCLNQNIDLTLVISIYLLDYRYVKWMNYFFWDRMRLYSLESNYGKPHSIE